MLVQETRPVLVNFVFVFIWYREFVSVLFLAHVGRQERFYFFRGTVFGIILSEKIGVFLQVLCQCKVILVGFVLLLMFVALLRNDMVVALGPQAPEVELVVVLELLGGQTLFVVRVFVHLAEVALCSLVVQNQIVEIKLFAFLCLFLLFSTVSF